MVSVTMYANRYGGACSRYVLVLEKPKVLRIEGKKSLYDWAMMMKK